MNLSLFRSIHVLTAGIILGGFWFWHLQGGISFGRGEGSDRDYLLWTGWVAFALFLVLALYALRKSAHKTRITPEFKMKVPIEQLEKAESRLSQLRVRMLSGELTARGQIQSEAGRILREEGVAHVIRVRVEAGSPGGGRYRLLVRPREPIGRLAAWMHVHIYMGLTAAGMVWFHGGGNIGSPMGLLLNSLSLLVILTGVIGIFLWTFGPAWLTRSERDLSLEKSFSLREHYARKVTELAEELREKVDAKLVKRLLRIGSGPGLLSFAGPALQTLPESGPRRGVQDLLALMGQRSNVEREWRRLHRVWLCLHIWRAVHVPASILLLAAVAVHVVSVTWY